MKFSVFPEFSLPGVELSSGTLWDDRNVLYSALSSMAAIATDGLYTLKKRLVQVRNWVFSSINLDWSSHRWLVAIPLDSTVLKAWKHHFMLLSCFLALSSLCSPLQCQSFSLFSLFLTSPAWHHLLASMLHPKARHLPWVWEHVSWKTLKKWDEKEFLKISGAQCTCHSCLLFDSTNTVYVGKLSF